MKIKQRAKGFWQKWENIDQLIKPHIINGRFPTQTELVKKVKGRIGTAIADFGGIHKVAERMGYQLDYIYKSNDGHFLDSVNELIFDEYLHCNKIAHEVHGLIKENDKHRFDFKVGDIYIEVWGFEQGREDNKFCNRYNEKRSKKEELYNNLNFKFISIEANVFKKNPEEIKIHFDKIVLENKLAEIANNESLMVIKNTVKHSYYWNEDKIKEELEVIMENIGHFPTFNELYEMKRGDLKDAISRHGGQHHFAKLLETECKRKEEGHWTDKTIKAELKIIVEEIKDFLALNA